MGAYVYRRLLGSLLGLFITTIVVFGLLRFLPGDVVTHLLYGNNDPAAAEALRDKLGLNKSFLEAYASWAGGMLRGDLGESLFYGDSVSSIIKERLPVTLELTLVALFVSILVAFPIGILSAVTQGSMADYLGRGFAILFVSVPFFWLAVLVVVVPARTIGWSPPIGFKYIWDDPMQNISVLIIPALLLGISLSGRTIRMLRTQMLEVLRLDYVRTARAKGLKERTIVVRHALRNALIPVVTIIGLEFAFLMGGTIIVESIFGIPGMGLLVYDALRLRDYNVVMGALVVFAAILITVNLVVDISYGFLNPRLRT
jgi:peptide/nickel transport system permease protein